MDDKECALRCLDGEQSAIRFFVERFHGPLFKLCWRRLRNREDAEDVTQESLVRALQYLRRWDPERPLAPWVIKIAMNCCSSHITKRNRQIQPVESLVEAPAKQCQAVTFELSEGLQMALSKIRDQHRTCFVLFHLQGLDIARIAEIMDCPKGTVKTWLHRARLDLGQLLVSQGVVSREGYEVH